MGSRGETVTFPTGILSLETTAAQHPKFDWTERGRTDALECVRPLCLPSLSNWAMGKWAPSGVTADRTIVPVVYSANLLEFTMGR